VRRLVLCSGKVYVDLISSDLRPASPAVAICRVEQLYPFPNVAIGAVLETYDAVEEIVWVQEEPENMGAWEFLHPLLEALVAGRAPLRYVGRPRAASPSEGSSAWHQMNQKALVQRAFDLESHAADQPSPVLSTRA
jgi:2-oxoglutarate dehydrogenase E1 component